MFLLIAFSCNAATTQEIKFWGAISALDRFTETSPWAYYLEAEGRFNFSEQGFSDAPLRVGIGYYIMPNLSFWLGYYYSFDNYSSKNENRLWQQILWDVVKRQKFQITSRTRLEQIERKDESQIVWQARERLMFLFPQVFSTKFIPQIGDEVFINCNKPNWISNNSLSQNRAIVGVLIPLTKKMTLEVDYINQYLSRPGKNTLSHVLYMELEF